MIDSNVQAYVRVGSVNVFATGELHRGRGRLRADRLARAPGVVDPVIVGILGAAVSLVGAGRPSFWYDGQGWLTISASYGRSPGQLWRMLSNVDVVHGPYYRIMHGCCIRRDGILVARAEWVGCWRRRGRSSGAGKQFSSRTVAVTSGLLCAILPRSDVGRHRSSPVCPFDDGRRVADSAARSCRAP